MHDMLRDQSHEINELKDQLVEQKSLLDQILNFVQKVFAKTGIEIPEGLKVQNDDAEDLELVGEDQD